MSDLKVRLSGYLPAAEMDGLQPLLQGLVDEPKAKRLAVAVIDVATRRDHGDGEWEPTVRVLQIEVPQGALRDELQQLLHKAYSARTGAMQMFEEDGSGGWGVGGQAGSPLVPKDGTTPLVDDQADPEGEGWEQPADLDAIQAGDGEAFPADAVDEGLEAAVEAAAAEEPFQSEEAPQPVQDQVAAKRGRKSTKTED